MIEYGIISWGFKWKERERRKTTINNWDQDHWLILDQLDRKRRRGFIHLFIKKEEEENNAHWVVDVSVEDESSTMPWSFKWWISFDSFLQLKMKKTKETIRGRGLMNVERTKLNQFPHWYRMCHVHQQFPTNVDRVVDEQRNVCDLFEEFQSTWSRFDVFDQRQNYLFSSQVNELCSLFFNGPAE